MYVSMYVRMYNTKHVCGFLHMEDRGSTDLVDCIEIMCYSCCETVKVRAMVLLALRYSL